jgi:hypothetical protein
MATARPALTALLVALLLASPSRAKNSTDVVKATATAGKIGTDGKQAVTVTLTVDDKYHIYANPVGNDDYVDVQTKVTPAGKAKLVKAEYPTGTEVVDKVVGKYKVYKGKVTIKATVQRPKGDTGPLELSIRLQACNKTSCLLPGTLKVKAKE